MIQRIIGVLMLVGLVVVVLAVNGFSAQEILTALVRIFWVAVGLFVFIFAVFLITRTDDDRD